MNIPEAPVTLRLSLTVTYAPNGTPAHQLRDMLASIADYAAGNGMLTNETPAEVDAWIATVERVKEPAP